MFKCVICKNLQDGSPICENCGCVALTKVKYKCKICGLVQEENDYCIECGKENLEMLV